MVRETNYTVDYHLMAIGHSFQLEVWGKLGERGGAVSPPADPGKHPGGGLEFFEYRS